MESLPNRGRLQRLGGDARPHLAVRDGRRCGGRSLRSRLPISCSRGFTRPGNQEIYSGTVAGAPNSIPFRSLPSHTTIAANANTVTAVSAMLVA
jgi:hypothetical protein